MIPPFLASSIIFVIWLAYEIKKHRRLEKKVEESFWEKETRANSTRRKSLDSLPYITIPMKDLPFSTMDQDPTVAEVAKILSTLSQLSIVNFTGVSNTDLKLQYGAANITSLMEYDQNYTLLVRTLQKWAECLYQSKYTKEARTILEFAISIQTDVSKSYFLLAELYFLDGSYRRIQELITSASQLNSILKDSIVHTLQESYPYID